LENGLYDELGYELKEWLAKIIISQTTMEKFTTIRSLEKEVMLGDKPITLKLELTTLDEENRSPLVLHDLQV
jgi:hypothetical protein